MHSWAWLQTALPALSTSIALLVTALGVLATALALGIGLMAFEDRTGSATIPFESAVLAHVHTTRLRVPFGVDARMSSTLLKVTNDFERGLTQVRLSPPISTGSRLRSRPDLASDLDPISPPISARSRHPSRPDLDEPLIASLIRCSSRPISTRARSRSSWSCAPPRRSAPLPF
jgi:hypothetical protein